MTRQRAAKSKKPRATSARGETSLESAARRAARKGAAAAKLASDDDLTPVSRTKEPMQLLPVKVPANLIRRLDEFVRTAAEAGEHATRGTVVRAALLDYLRTRGA